VYAVDDLGGVYRFDEQTGHRFWDYQFPANVTFGSPLVADEALYLGMDDGSVAALHVSNGHLVWRGRLALAPVGAWSPSGDLLLVSAIGPRGGILALTHDPGGVLIDEPSPTELNLPVALANFAGAFLIVAALLLGVFGVLGRRRRARGGEDALVPGEEEHEPVKDEDDEP
jgi:hypothetical protein